MDKKILDIIIFSDDYHASKIWINGIFINDCSDLGNLISGCIRTCKNKNFDEVEVSSVWGCDDFDELDDDGEDLDNIYFWFETVKFMSEDQIKYVKTKNSW